MITDRQIKQLATQRKIDRFTIFREYLQLLFLNYLYQYEKSGKIFLKGGTAIHLLLNSPRFSEDLDFSTKYNKREIKKVINHVKKALEEELVGVKISLLHQGVKSTRFKLGYKAVNFKYPFSIRVDFTEKERPKKVLSSPLVTDFPLNFFPIVLHYPAEEILAEKIRAFLKREKGRDIFDIWFLLSKGVMLDYDLVDKKMKEIDRRFDGAEFVQKIKRFPLKKLALDLNKFLPQPQRKIIKLLQESLVSKLPKKKGEIE